MDWEQPLVRNRELPFQVVGDEVIVIAPRAWKTHLIEGVGMDIWALLETPRTEAALLPLLEERYDVKRDELRRDLRAFLESMLSEQLIAAAEDRPPPKSRKPA